MELRFQALDRLLDVCPAGLVCLKLLLASGILLDLHRLEFVNLSGSVSPQQGPTGREKGAVLHTIWVGLLLIHGQHTVL